MKKILSILLAAIPAASFAQLPVYLNENASIEERVQDALSQMTLEEKVRLSYAQSKFSSPGVPRLGIPELWLSDGPHGVRMEINWNDWGHSHWTNDSITAFPALTCLAATWNTDLAYLYGLNVGEEARYRKKNVLLGPGVNIYRTPLNGRNFEYMGEDPYLAGVMAVPYINGLQYNGVAPCLKHYVLNEQEEFRGHVNVHVSDRAFHEIYFAPFRRAIEETGVWSIMGSYNQYLNIHNSHNDVLINQRLKHELGWDGALITDWGAAHDSRQAALFGLDLEMGTYTNGLTTEATGFSYEDYYLANGYRRLIAWGEVPDSIINDKAARMLRLIFRTWKSRNTRLPHGAINTPEHQQTAWKIASEGIVLLKNDAPRSKAKDRRPLLPIDTKRYRRILVVGDNATRSLTAGGGSSELKPKVEISPLDGLRARFEKTELSPLFASLSPFPREATTESDVEIAYTQGYTAGASFYGRVFPVDTAVYDSLRAEAVAQAREADLVIYIGGLNKNHFQDCEGGDRLQYNLDFHQDELIEALLDVNPNMICVITSGNAVAMPWLNRVPALVQSWYLGSMSGMALAEILAGDVSPSGKTIFSYPIDLSDSPAHQYGRIGYPGVRPEELPDVFKADGGRPSSELLLRGNLPRPAPELTERNVSEDPRTHFGFGDEEQVYHEDILVGYRWFDYYNTNGLMGSKRARVNFPFGYGLSYTTFSYGRPVITDDCVEVEITNTGAAEGCEVVQFYVSEDRSSVIRPKKELKHFAKVNLKPGETQKVTYRIKPEDLMYFDEQSQAWKADAGLFHIHVAASSIDIRGSVKYQLNASLAHKLERDAK